MKFIIDASPALSWVAAGELPALIKLAEAYGARIAVCARVDHEVQGKARDERFARTGVDTRWTTLKQSNRVTLLPDAVIGASTHSYPDDDETAKFERLPEGVSSDVYAELLGKMLEIVCLGTTAQDRVRKGKDLGEDLSTAHALALAVLGHDVILHIDEGRGRAEAKRAVKRMMDGYAETGIITVTDSAKLLKG